MNLDNISLFEHVNGFSDADSAAVQAISPILVALAPQLTDKFYGQLVVTSRTIIRPFMKQMRVGGVPLLHGLHGGLAL